MSTPSATLQRPTSTQTGSAAPGSCPICVYTSEAFFQASERVLQLRLCDHHSRLDPIRLAAALRRAALRRAALRPADPANVELLDSLPLVVYVTVV